MSEPEHRAREVFGRRAAWYASSRAHTDRSVLDQVVALAEPRSDALVLDVATGTGHTAFALAPFVRAVVAVDITPEMLDEGRRLRAQKGLANVSFALAGAAHLPFVDASFDLVTCRRAPHHFADIHQALREMYRLLRIGGRLVIDDRSVPEDDFVDATMNRLDSLHDESHVREYRPAEWADMLTETGFAIADLRTYAEHRPLSSLTAGVAPERVAEIEAIISSLSESQRLAMNVVEKSGQVFTNHWFVMVTAVRPTVAA
jgi:ubiquinone/menaquinone biosynthesis C-methylase UbiE